MPPTKYSNFPGIGDWEPEGSDDGIARIWCPDLLHEGQWHNLVALSEQERDAKLYEMLPLFCKVSEPILIKYMANNSPSLQVFSSCPANDMSEKFWDVVAFCQQVSRLMVSEIRKRASNQSTEAASIAIVKFLEVETTEETSSGWMLLATLNLLANGDVSLIQVCCI